MTDIWRSFVAEHACGNWAAAWSSTVPRLSRAHPHNLLSDFRDEVPGYLNNGRLVQTLAGLTLRPGPGAVLDNLLCCYEALIAEGFLPTEERPLVRAWAADLEAVAGNLPRAGAAPTTRHGATRGADQSSTLKGLVTAPSGA